MTVNELYICEKPSQGRDLAKVLGLTQKTREYLFDGKGTVVTWAFGHLLEQLMPDEYDEKYKSWSLDSLPIIPDEWRSKVKESSAGQFKAIESLIKKAKSIYISTDFDREGEAIARSLLDRVGYSGQIYRLPLTSLDDASIRKALSNVKNGKETISLYHAALCRQRADWLIGINMSRLYTVLAREVGFREALHVGRVLTPLVTLVCDRDNQIANFKPTSYWDLVASVKVQDGEFKAKWAPPEQHCDEGGRCINKSIADDAVLAASSTTGTIASADTKKEKELAPLTFNLTTLQRYASRHWGYTAKKTLSIAQALYEVHKVASYPRSDSRYLPESQHSEAGALLEVLARSSDVTARLVANATPQNKSRVFNDSKVTAHHGIVPTLGVTAQKIKSLSSEEFNVFDAIQRHYIAQFYGDYIFDKTTIKVDLAGYDFTTTGRVPLEQGWKVLFNAEPDSEGGEDSDEQDNLPKVVTGEPAIPKDIAITEKATRPPAHFTEDSLLAAMENIARFVPEEKYKKILRDTAGLGTEATRADMLEGAETRGYFTRKKKQIIPTDKAHALISALPSVIKSPGLTAVWEQELELIASGDGCMESFMQNITGWINQIVSQLKGAAPSLTTPNGPLAQSFAKAIPPVHNCFTCKSGELRRINGKNGYFWGCRGSNCGATFPDAKGKPEARVAESDGPACEMCGSNMRLRQGLKPGGKRKTKFWGCSAYPECRGIKAFKKSDLG